MNTATHAATAAKWGKMRWYILFAASCQMCAIYLVYNIPAALSTSLQEHLGISDAQYAYLISALYTAYSVPNFVLPFISGFAAQRYGEKTILIYSVSIAIAGQLVFSIGIKTRHSWLLIMGRFLLGMGGEVPAVISCEKITRRFYDSIPALAFAIYLSTYRFGSVAANVMVPHLTEQMGVVAANSISTAIALVVVIPCAAYLAFADAEVSNWKTSSGSFLDSFRRLTPKFWILNIVGFSFYGCFGPFNNSAQRFLASRFYDNNQTKGGFAISITNTLAAALVIPFGLLVEIPRFKNYLLSIRLSLSLLAMAHSLFLFQIGGAIIPLVLLGLGYGLFGVTYWPAIPIMLIEGPTSKTEGQTILQDSNRLVRDSTDSDSDSDSESETTAALFDHSGSVSEPHATKENEDLVIVGYGIATSSMNIGMGLIPVVLSIMEVLAGYSGLEMTFLTLSVIAILASVGLAKMGMAF